MKRQILDFNYWNNKREIVKNSYEYNNNWDEIIKRFENRIEDFYFIPIDRVKDPNKLKGEGFSILTIQCALIEMFAAFKYGKIHKHDKKNSDPNYTYKRSDECFIPFLHSESIFENHFHKFQGGTIEIDQPFSATDFYIKVRCGLMHEARTKGEWIINAKKTYEGNETSYITREKNTNKISIDRTLLNIQLKKYFQVYLESLSQNSAESAQLRRLFARKLDHLYDITPDPENYDWWNDN